MQLVHAGLPITIKTLYRKAEPYIVLMFTMWLEWITYPILLASRFGQWLTNTLPSSTRSLALHNVELHADLMNWSTTVRSSAWKEKSSKYLNLHR